MSLPGSAARLAGTGLVIVLALTGGALLHRNLPTARRALVTRVNAALVKAVPGKIVIEQIGHLALDGIAGVGASVTDPDGATVLHVSDLRARIDLGALARSLRSGGPVEIDLPDLSAASIDVNLDPGPGGALRIASAFVPQTPPAPSPPGRGVHLQVREVQFDRVTVRGSPLPTLPLDIDMDRVAVVVEVAPGVARLDRIRGDVTARGLPPGAITHGLLEARLEQPSIHGGEHAARVTWNGTVGGIPTTAGAWLDGNGVYAVVDAPTIRPEDLAVLWPASPLTEVASAHVEVFGLLPTVLVSARVTAGRGAIEATGPVILPSAQSSTTCAAIRLQTSSLDARSASARAPVTKLDVSGNVLMAMTGGVGGGAMGGVAALDLAGSVGPTLVPRTTIAADFSRDGPPSNAMRGQAHLVIREAGAPSTMDATITPKGDSLEVAFDANVVVPDLDHVLRLGPMAQGSARLTAHGHFDTETARVDANVSARASHVSAGGVALESLAIDARASGPLAAPQLDGELHGENLDLVGTTVKQLHADIHGPASGAEVSLHLGNDQGHVQAKATVAVLGGSATVRDLRVHAEHGGETATLEATKITVNAKEQRIDDAEIRGFGAPLHVTAQAVPGAITLKSHSHKIDLERVARFAGITAKVTGDVSLDVDATLHRTGAEGHVVVDVTRAILGPLGDSEAHVDVSLGGRNITGMASARVGDVGTLTLQSSSLEIGGTGVLDAASWRSTWGTVDVQGHLDLARLASQLPAARLPVSQLAGDVEVHGHVGRDSASDTSPDVALTATTRGLAATGPAASPWTLRGVDLEADLTVDSNSARTALDAHATDLHGVLASVTLGSDSVPYGRVFSLEEPISTVLRALPFTGTVTVPERQISDFPTLLGTRGVHGLLAGTVSWAGTVDHPTVDVHATLGGGGASERVLAALLDLTLTGHYDGDHLTTELVASDRSKPLLDATADVDVRATDLLARLGPDGGALPWKASAHARLTRFPLQSLAALDDRQVRGHLSGDLSLQGLHDDAHATLDLSSNDLAIGEVDCKTATVKASLDGQAMDAQTHIDQTDGTLQATAHTGAHWGAALAPTLDVAQTAEVTLAAKTFRVDLIQPLVESVFSELDGRLDASVQIHADPARRQLQPQGSLHLTGGVIQVQGIGGEFHDATAEIDLTPDGVVRLQKASALGLSGKLEAAATARFDGLTFAGARASLQVVRQQPLPMVLDGVQVGTFVGQVNVAADPIAAAQGGGLDVKVDVPQMNLQLPDQLPRAVQSLGTLDDVTIGMQRPGRAFVVVPLGGHVKKAAATGAPPAPLRVTVALGQDVEVRRGTQLQVYLGGSPTVVVTDQVHATGQVRLVRGSLDVQGKTFNIESGTVTFVDDPTNPQVVLEASWAAPDGTTIYADFIGPLKTGKVTLRADPPRPQDEILSLILFGTTDETAQSGSGGATAQQSSAVGAAGGAATAPINQALGGVNQMLDNFGLVGGISTRVDTSQATPRPEVEVQIARDLSVQVAWVLGVPPPGSNPDSTLFTLDWRFLRSWSLETTVGDAGTSILDLIWQHRY